MPKMVTVYDAGSEDGKEKPREIQMAAIDAKEAMRHDPARYSMSPQEPRKAKVAEANGKTAEKPTAKQPELARDDLTRISGIGPATAEKLRAEGYDTFDKIAALTKDQAGDLDAKLTLRGSIERDTWQEQAKKLAAEKG